MMTRAECAHWLLARDHFVIITHGMPDGDTLGSGGALCRVLREAGKTAFVLENPETPDHLAYLCRDLTIAAPMEGATLVSVDVATPKMLCKEHLVYLEQIQLRIDHHGTATSFTELELVDPSTAACAEIIYDLMELMGVKMTRQIAIPMYTGTATDTGCFRYANTNAHTFQVAAACAATGADLQPINQALFDTVSLNKLRVQAWVTEHTQFLFGGKAAVCVMPLGLAQQLGVKEEEVGGMAGFIRSIEGVCLAVTVRADSDGKTYLSTRGIPGYDCAAICVRFGGGGHKGAAGAGTELTPEQILPRLMEALEQQFGETV